MEGPSNGGLLYHEVQEGKLCAVHCVNTVLQGPFFSELDLAALASDLDLKERQVMLGEPAAAAPGDFLSEGSHNVSLGGDFSIQVLQKALEVWDLQVIPLNSPAAEGSMHAPELESCFICHLQDHWFCIRKVNGEWYNFNSLYPAPEHLSKFYLSAYLDSLKGSGWSIFAVRGSFPNECPMSSEASYGFGQWLTREDAKRITSSCNQVQAPKPSTDSKMFCYSPESMSEADMIAVQQEEADLNAAIAASLMDCTGSGTGSGMVNAVSGKFDENSRLGESGAGAPIKESMHGIIPVQKEDNQMNSALVSAESGARGSCSESSASDSVDDKTQDSFSTTGAHLR